MAIRSIDIRPGVSVLSVLRHLNYKPWFALAEFVDNSIQSYVANRDALKAQHGDDFRLTVRIDLDTTSPAKLSIKDNAGGISALDYPRAFRPAAVPPDKSGLSEFGMGMKSAACWFSPSWYVRTSAMGEPVERNVRFDIDKIVNDDLQELKIVESPGAAESHFTEIILEELHHPLIGRTLGKIKEHLADIYRVFLREGTLQLFFRGEAITYSDPNVLVAPHYRDQLAEPREWKKEIAFDFGQELSVSGFAALREPASTTHAGFSLFRRKRLIEGSADEKYRPQLIFGNPNSYRYQRLFGELHLQGFEVSHTKDGFQWDENEQAFLELLKEHLDSAPLALLDQAEGWRARAARSAITPVAQHAVTQTALAIEHHLPSAMPALVDALPVEAPTVGLPAAINLASKEFSIMFRGRTWHIQIEVTDDPAESEWLSLGNAEIEGTGSRRLQLRVAVAHPFMVRFAQLNEQTFEAILRLAAAIGISELVARDSGIQKAGTFRRNINEILTEALSKA
jgi:hypothetical protein